MVEDNKRIVNDWGGNGLIINDQAGQIINDQAGQIINDQAGHVTQDAHQKGLEHL